MSSPTAWEAAPLDLLKIRFQVQVGVKSTKFPRHYMSLVHALSTIYREEGLRTFWRGNVAATLLWVSYSGVQFGTYQALRNVLVDVDGDGHDGNHWALNSLIGATSGVVATVSTYPFDRCRTVISSQGVPKVYHNMRHFFAASIQREGIKGGLFKGLGPTVSQIIPYMGLSFGIYTTLNEVTSSSTQSRFRWMLQTVGNGAIAGFVSKLLVYPLDTIKKRMQMQGVPRHIDYGYIIPSYSSSLQCGRDIFRHEGLQGLYKGTIPSLIKSMLTHSCTFTIYEFTAHSLHCLNVLSQ
ncbi:hypothetical protein, variant [Aphanomyces invadans]|uniref:Mitochondrial thiamine pyrophosphate carrier 1 n=1 Tax=Aphanomyces invadans TaxID=157072 RepID=A0A024UQC7_9STRA|nr:hypothetical protein, variant [Aphanomyces invadans]ETW08651.1 hypothetical protein, variant [Aphanomyces invadans]|eukprot:XP_008862456.1 hypothetical protein, variant [Aphanomyces invadans]